MSLLWESVVISILAFLGVFIVLILLMAMLKCLKYADIFTEKAAKENGTKNGAANKKH